MINRELQPKIGLMLRAAIARINNEGVSVVESIAQTPVERVSYARGVRDALVEVLAPGNPRWQLAELLKENEPVEPTDLRFTRRLNYLQRLIAQAETERQDGGMP